MGLEQVVSQLFVGPVRPVEPTAGRAADDPGADRVGQGVGEGGGLALGLSRGQGVQPAVAGGVEPAGDAAAVEGKVLGDLLTRSAGVSQQDDLEAVTELAIVGGAEQPLQPSGLRFGQRDADPSTEWGFASET